MKRAMLKRLTHNLFLFLGREMIISELRLTDLIK